MLDYEWGNPSNMMLTGNEDGSPGGSDQAHRQIFDNYASHNFLPDYFLHGPGPTQTTTTTPAATNTDFSHSHHFNPQAHHQAHSFYDPRAYHGASSTSYPPPQPPPPPSMLSLDPMPHVNSGPGFLMVPKSEDMGRPMDFVGSRIGLNLGGRTYFSSAEDDFVSRLYRRSRPAEPGSATSSNSPRCQAEGCNADLSQAKHYHRRHKVCEFHSKASTVIAAGLTQRFCQQCSRFHLLSEFDNGKRSCRKRLADHNRRRRKTQQPTQEIPKSQLTLDNVSRSPPDSGAQSSSSVTVAVSPPDYFRQRPYQSSSPSTTSSSLFFSSG
ncbi:hypothetical protein RIF29_18246 [Crotalaria pallida]|uniref:SBP-type domain-containing protein n=1 Tax=Crotalaria pallida TaxID=3830 RepID=A0AAN9FLW0_CROPI